MRALWTGATLAIALGCAVTLAGQATTQDQPTTTAKTITLVGCLQRGDATAGAIGTSGTSSTGATARTGSGQWMLVNATMDSAAGASKPSDTAATGTSGTSYVLDGKADELTTHAGHKVEITGTPTAGSASSSSPSSTGGAAGATTSAAATPHLQVTTVKMVAANCQ